MPNLNYIINSEIIPRYQLIAAQPGSFHSGSFPESSDHKVCRSLIRVNRKDCWKPIRRLSLFFVLKQRRAEVTLGAVAEQRDDFARRAEVTRHFQSGGHVRSG